MIAGVFLGPSLLGFLLPGFQAHLFPKESLKVLYVGAQLGVGLYMFIVGVEFDIKTFAFSDSLSAVDDPARLKADGEDTDLNRGLKSFLFNLSGREYRGIVLLSDGRFDVNTETASLVRDMERNGIRFVPVLLSEAASARDDEAGMHRASAQMRNPSRGSM